MSRVELHQENPAWTWTKRLLGVALTVGTGAMLGAKFGMFTEAANKSINANLTTPTANGLTSIAGWLNSPDRPAVPGGGATA